MLDHIHIENFRLFKNLDIPKVGQVNLITGKNNSGKTTLLEALRLWANRDFFIGVDSIIGLILIERGEADGNNVEAYKTLFFNKKEVARIQINQDLEIAFNKEQPSLEIISPALRGFLTISSSKISVNPAHDFSFYVPASFNLTNARLKDIKNNIIIIIIIIT